MPFISVDANVPLDAVKRKEIKKELGRLITMLPGKTESLLMVAIRQNQAMYFAGEGKPCAYVDVRLYRQSPLPEKREFTGALTRMISERTGVREADIFVTISEHEHWGTRGDFI